jgi:hypothetical protein
MAKHLDSNERREPNKQGVCQFARRARKVLSAENLQFAM